jgi:hypothetical protein
MSTELAFADVVEPFFVVMIDQILEGLCVAHLVVAVICPLRMIPIRACAARALGRFALGRFELGRFELGRFAPELNVLVFFFYYSLHLIIPVSFFY